MTTTVTRELVRQYFEACVSRDPARLAPCLHDDVEWSVAGPVDVLPFCGERHGKSAVVDTVVRLAASSIRMTGLELEEILIDGDRAATFSRLSAVHAETGRNVSYRCAQFLRFHDGKVIEFRGMMDSFDAAEQILGHPIDVAAPNVAHARNVFTI